MGVGLATLRRRNRQPEWMDQPDLDAGMHAHALRSLSRINQISRTSLMVWRPILQLARELRSRQPLRVLDLACGGGDVVIGLSRQARRARVPLTVDGCDISPVALAYANERARRAGIEDASFFEQDALSGSLPDSYDVVTCSLFLHHLDEPQAENVLRSMSSAAREMVVVSDLRRNRLAYLLAWLGCRLLTRSPIVHKDGPLSVAAAFTLEEARSLATRAGLTSATIAPCFPQRFLLVWRKPA